MSLVTPHVIQALQRKLYLKAKHVDEHRRERVASADTTQLFVRDHGSRESLCASETAQAFRMNLVREPDAGNPHVRFDERDVETEYGWAIEAPPDERGGNR